MKNLFLTLLGMVLLPALTVSGQQKASNDSYARIKGVVLDASGGNQPINFATVQLLPQGTYVTTDAEGKFDFSKVNAGKLQMLVKFIGMNDIDTTFTVVANKDYNLVFKMKEVSFRIDEVTVQASQSKAGNSTSSSINRQAMDHLQASTISDIMQLLPGASISNPSMSGSNTITLRTLGGTGANASMNSLGTAIIMDGSPLSNNANLQMLSSSANGGVTNPNGTSYANEGVDLRNISLDNVESVEVIRGIPSVEYGDLTSGAVIVKSKAGKEPLSVRFKTNPRMYEVAASKGFNIGKKGGAMHISGDYAYNTSKQTEAYRHYEKYNIKGMWSQSIGHFNTNTSLEFLFGRDSRDRNPDDQRSQLASRATDLGVRFNSNGAFNFDNAGWLKVIRYSAQFSYTDKKSWEEQLLGNAFAAYSTAMVDGAVLANTPGVNVYDNNGNEVTNLAGTERDDFATYLPNEYFSRYDIYGKEINAFVKVNATLSKVWNSGFNKILIGADFKTDGNLGKGIVYDKITPPQRISANGGSAWRPRSFKDIPFINQIGAYIENSFSQDFGAKGRTLNITAGVRYDNVNGNGAFSPRVNASFELFPNVVTVRGGYGITSKAPTAMYLYPQKAYFDYINFNNLGDETIPAEEQLLIGSTRVYDVENKDLEIAKNYKTEVGLDIKFTKKISLSLTGYKEQLRKGYSLDRDINDFKLIPYRTYKIAESVPGAAPKLMLDKEQMIFASYYKPMNVAQSDNQGIEYILDFGRITPIRTSVSVSGAWMKTESANDNHLYNTSSQGNSVSSHIGVYEKKVYEYVSEKVNTTIRITHNIPKIGFVLTLTSQITWKDKDWTIIGNDTMLEKYISCVDGKVYDFDPAKKDDPEFAHLFYVRNDNRFIAESIQPYVLFNFLLSKEIGDFLTASFFVNNIFNNRPLYESKRNPGSYAELGIPTFFGFDIKINIK